METQFKIYNDKLATNEAKIKLDEETVSQNNVTIENIKK